MESISCTEGMNSDIGVSAAQQATIVEMIWQRAVSVEEALV